MAILKVIQGNSPGKKFDLECARSILGRSPDCEVVLDVAAVSRRHAVVTREADQFFIEDMGSRNGTFVNGQRVLDRAPLRDGDQVLICDMLLEFHHHAFPVNPIGLVGPGPGSSSLLELVGVDNAKDSGSQEAGDAPETDMSTIMTTLDVGGGALTDWQISAKPEAQLMAIIEIANNLAKVLGFDEILPKLLDSLFKIFVQADRGFVIMRPKQEAPLVPVASKARRVNEETDMQISRTIVQRAVDGKQAILSIQQLRPRLVILDVKMQHHSGFEVLKMIRADPELNETRVLILTAMRLKEEYRKAIELGADKFVTKPFSNKDLVADVHELLGPAE